MLGLGAAVEVARWFLEWDCTFGKRDLSDVDYVYVWADALLVLMIRLDPRPLIRLDADHHLSRPSVRTEVFADHRVQPGYSGDALIQLRLA